MKKIAMTLLGLCLSTTALADNAKTTLFNTSQDHYMTVTYAICNYDQCALPQTVNLYSAKASHLGKNYAEIETPMNNGKFNVVTLRILHAVEKEIVQGQPTDKVIAETKSKSVCDMSIGETTTHTTLTDGVLELNDMKGSPFVVCKKGFV